MRKHSVQAKNKLKDGRNKRNKLTVGLSCGDAEAEWRRMRERITESTKRPIIDKKSKPRTPEARMSRRGAVKFVLLTSENSQSNQIIKHSTRSIACE